MRNEPPNLQTLQVDGHHPAPGSQQESQVVVSHSVNKGQTAAAAKEWCVAAAHGLYLRLVPPGLGVTGQDTKA